ncbi:Peroxisomal membrane protein PAS20 [Borealophlyctis nickersoniae]|nr:Peroxisomal membrane protein PAS20 [Borealophlyctis nickersoniae]
MSANTAGTAASSAYSRQQPYGSTGYGGGYGSGYGGAYGSTTGYGSYGASSPYNSYGSSYGGYGTSPYNRLGSSYGSTYGGSTYGGYGSTYGSRYGGIGGYGGGYGASPYNRMGGAYGAQGPMGPDGGPLPLAAQLEQSTQSTFQTIDQIVQAFTGFSQMLESTFFATHSSFMAMLGVAEQLSHLKRYLGQAFSLVAIAGAVRDTLLGRRNKQPVDPSSLTAEGFKAFQETGALTPSPAQKKSRGPFILFLLFSVGIPYMISRLFKRLQQSRLEQAAATAALPNTSQPSADPSGMTPPMALVQPTTLHPSQIRDLEFARASYDFAGSSPSELSFKRGDVIAVLNKMDPATGQVGTWWVGRLKSGPVGMFPANYVEVLEKKAGSGGGVASLEVPSEKVVGKEKGGVVLDPVAFEAS